MRNDIPTKDMKQIILRIDPEAETDLDSWLEREKYESRQEWFDRFIVDVRQSMKRSRSIKRALRERR